MSIDRRILNENMRWPRQFSLRGLWPLAPIVIWSCQDCDGSVRRRFKRLRCLPLLLLLSGAFALPEPAYAQRGKQHDEDSLKQARERFAQAIALQTAGDWAGALALFKEVAAVRPTPQVRFNIALCEEKLGRLLAALGDYELAATDALSQNAALVAQEAEDRLESLRARVPRIVVQRGEGAEAATISLDGVALGDAVIGSPMPIDPGPHLVQATAPGYLEFREPFRVAEQQTANVRVRLEPAPSARRRSESESIGGEDSGGGTKTLGFVIGGVGVASLAASGVFFYLRSGAIDELDKACGPDRETCPDNLRDTEEQGRLYTTLTSVTLAVGAVGVAVGTTLILTSKSSRSSASITLSPSAPGALAGARVLGRF